MCEQFGRDNYEKISQNFNNKTVKDVAEYSKAFWKNWELIENGQRYVERIEKGEAEIQKMRSIDIAIDEKFKLLVQNFKNENPDKDLTKFTLDDIQIYRSDKKSLTQSTHAFDFSDIEDRFLSMCLYKYGYGYWEFFKNEIRNSQLFIFNWAAKSRSIADI